MPTTYVFPLFRGHKTQISHSQTALRLERAGFDQLPITTTDMRCTSSFRAQPFPRLIGNLVALLVTLTTPAVWSHFANEEAFPLLVFIFQAAQALNIPYNETYQVPSETVNLTTSLFKLGTGESGSNPAQNLTSHTREAITGADNFFDTKDYVTMKDVLDEIVDITRTVTPTCE